ncbi:hypothetical protein ACZ90_07210 [Streptomyces albus subsp. albus]|nr:hypothetical protein ACZ90_07210 [Streptomyces albus subsp. albus]
MKCEGQAAEVALPVELEPEDDDEDDDVDAAEVVEEDEPLSLLAAGLAGLLLDDAPRLSFR